MRSLMQCLCHICGGSDACFLSPGLSGPCFSCFRGVLWFLLDVCHMPERILRGSGRADPCLWCAAGGQVSVRWFPSPCWDLSVPGGARGQHTCQLSPRQLWFDRRSTRNLIAQLSVPLGLCCPGCLLARPCCVPRHPAAVAAPVCFPPRGEAAAPGKRRCRDEAPAQPPLRTRWRTDGWWPPP